MRIVGLVLGVIAVFFVGRVIYELLWLEQLAWPSLLLSLVAGAAGYWIYMAAPRERHVDPPANDAPESRR